MSTLFNQEAGPQPPRDVRSPIEILSLLKNIQQRRDPLRVTFPERTQKFQSFIVQIDTATKMLWIDEMIPRDGDRYATAGEAFRVDAWHEGVHMRWDCAGAQRLMLEGVPTYCAPLPEEMIYHQKRGAFRAAVKRGMQLGLHLGHAKRDVSLDGTLVDISATGCKARFSGDCTSQLPPGDLFEHSWLELPETGRLSTGIEIRHAHYGPDSNETQVGLMFHNPAAGAQRQIDRFVNFLQREARRLEKEDLF
ncbi:flagellar brake protein [Halopseudomonas sp.]|uniref:flagellar brake protein n=1 Tax=Halopseudomonas sp. TaxID=2901191 RepID=UPI0035689129